ncbi:hypothetical protein STEG23_037605 [Scotinomys teguina]
MKALMVVLLVLLLSGQSGRAQEEDGDVDLEPERYDYDDDYEEEEEETNMIPGSRDREHLQCYTCQALHSGESCNQTQSCYHKKTFCTTFISHGNTVTSARKHLGLLLSCTPSALRRSLSDKACHDVDSRTRFTSPGFMAPLLAEPFRWV